MGKVYQLRITLRDSKPPIWRRVLVDPEMTLGELHDVIQIAMGWTDSHLHHFRLLSPESRLLGAPPRIFAPSDDAMFGDGFGMDEDEDEDEDDVTLGEVCPKVKSKLVYEYDFGDGWQHQIEVQKILDDDDPKAAVLPVCLAGKGACPPEDCGGVFGYYDLLEAVSDPSHPEHEDLSEWLEDDFDPDAFDVAEVNEVLAEWSEVE